jgi:hypothetical protein
MTGLAHAAGPAGSPIAAGLDLFAAAWLQSWTDAGGFVAIGENGRACASFAEYSDSKAYVAPAAGLPPSVQRDADTWRDGHYCGTMRALLAVLETVPGGWEALRHHMTAHGLNAIG